MKTTHLTNITITIPQNTTVYLTKHIMLIKNFGKTISEKDKLLWKQHITKTEITADTVHELSEILDLYDVEYNRGGILSIKEYLYNYINVSSHLLVKYEEYYIIVNKANVIYNEIAENVENVEKTYKFNVKDSVSLYIKYKNTTEEDIQTFCQAYDAFEPFKDYSNGYSNKELLELYKNRITKCVLKGKFGKIIEKLI